MKKKTAILGIILLSILGIFIPTRDLSSLSMTPQEFATKYNNEIDKLAGEKGKTLNYLKIFGTEDLDATSGYFKFAHENYHVNWSKESAEAKNINRLEISFHPSPDTNDDTHVFLNAIASTAASEDGDYKKILETLNKGYDVLNAFSENSRIAVAANYKATNGKKTCFIASSSIVKNDEQILAIKEAAAKEETYDRKVAEDQEWREKQSARNQRLMEEANSLENQDSSFFADSSRDLNLTPQEFLEAYNKTIVSQGRYDGKDYSKWKPTAVVNNKDELIFNSASARIVCTKDPSSGKICAAQTTCNIQVATEVGREWDVAMLLMTMTSLVKSEANHYVAVNLRDSFNELLKQSPYTNHFQTATDKGVLFFAEYKSRESIKWGVCNENYYYSLKN